MRVFNYRKLKQFQEKQSQKTKKLFKLSFALNSMYTHGNAYFKKQKLSLLIFTCSKLTIKTPEQGAKSVKS